MDRRDESFSRYRKVRRVSAGKGYARKARDENGGWCFHQPPLRRAAPVSKVPCGPLILERSGVAALPSGEPFGWSAALLGIAITDVNLSARPPPPSLPAPVLRFPTSTLRRVAVLVPLRMSSGFLALPFPSEPVSRAHPEALMRPRVAPAKNRGSALWIARITGVITIPGRFRKQSRALGPCPRKMFAKNESLGA